MSEKEVLSGIDQLYDDRKHQEAYDLIVKHLAAEKINKAELQWRMARACKELCKSYLLMYFKAAILGANDSKIYEKYLKEGYQNSKEAYELNGESPDTCKWYAVFLDLIGRLDGITARIKNSYEKAIEMQPDDFVANHSLGVWHFEVSDLPYAKRLAAKAFFATPPTSKYENALPYLLKADEVFKDKPYVGNNLYLAKTYYQLSKYADAKIRCRAIIDSDAEDLDTLDAKKEASQLIKKL